MNLFDSFFSLGFLLSSLRLATPLIFSAQAGLLSERSGIAQIGLEGFMLVGAFSGAVCGFYLKSAMLGFFCAFIFGLIFSLLFSLFTVTLKSEQIIVGTAFNFLVAGLIPFFSKYLFNTTGSTPPLDIENRFTWEPILFAAIIVSVIHYWLNHLRSGYWLQFAGENPECLQSAGVNVAKVRYFALSLTGGIAALGGACLSLFLSSSYSPLMTSGRGFISLSAVILGKWKPLPTLFVCLLFGFLDALQIQLQGVRFNNVTIPVQWIQILPYVITILILVGFFGKSQAPSHLGKKDKLKT